MGPCTIGRDGRVRSGDRLGSSEGSPGVVTGLMGSKGCKVPCLPRSVCTSVEELSVFESRLARSEVEGVGHLRHRVGVCFPRCVGTFKGVSKTFALRMLGITPVPSSVMRLRTRKLGDL